MARVAFIWVFAGILANLLTELPVVAVAASLGSGGPAAPTIFHKRSESDHVAQTRRTAALSRANRRRYARGDSTTTTTTSTDRAVAPGNVWIGEAGRRALRNSGVRGGSDAERAVHAGRARRMVVALRGGSGATAAMAGGSEREEGEFEAAGGRADVVVRSIKVLVSTTKISSYVDAVSHDAFCLHLYRNSQRSCSTGVYSRRKLTDPLPVLRATDVCLSL